jgi:hypothetical protein
MVARARFDVDFEASARRGGVLARAKNREK